MITYVHNVSYDIAEGNSYDGLYKFLESFGNNYGRITKSSFIVATTLTSEEFRDQIRSKLGTNDKVFVTTLVKGTSRWTGIIDSDEKIQAIFAQNTYK